MIFTRFRAVFNRPTVGVRPPSLKAEQSSIRCAPIESIRKIQQIINVST